MKADVVRRSVQLRARRYQAIVRSLDLHQATSAAMAPIRGVDPHIDRFVETKIGEKKVLELHKHWVVMVFPALRLILATVLQVWAAFAGPINLIFWHPSAFWFLWLPGFAIGLHAAYRVVDNYRDRIMVSTIRLGWFHGVLSLGRSFVPIQKVLDVTVKRPLVGRWLNYGHFELKSAAELLGLYRISYVKDIDRIQQILMSLIVVGELPTGDEEPAEDGT